MMSSEAIIVGYRSKASHIAFARTDSMLLQRILAVRPCTVSRQLHRACADHVSMLHTVFRSNITIARCISVPRSRMEQVTPHQSIPPAPVRYGGRSYHSSITSRKEEVEDKNKAGIAGKYVFQYVWRADSNRGDSGSVCSRCDLMWIWTLFVASMKDVTKRIDGGKALFQNANLSFYDGAKIGVIGVNGTKCAC